MSGGGGGSGYIGGCLSPQSYSRLGNSGNDTLNTFALAPSITDPSYISGVGAGGAGSSYGNAAPGGDGLVVITPGLIAVPSMYNLASFIRLRVFAYIYICICVWVCVYVCACMFVCVCMYAYIYLFIFICLCKIFDRSFFPCKIPSFDFLMERIRTQVRSALSFG